MNEAARMLGKSTGSVYGTAHRMLAEGLLVADSDEPTRGTQYELTEEGRRLLEDPAGTALPAGAVSEGQRFVYVDGILDQVKVQRLLTHRSLLGVLAWAAELDGGLLLMMRPETERNAVQRVATAFNAAGLRSAHRRIGEFIEPRDLRSEAMSALDLAASVNDV